MPNEMDSLFESVATPPTTEDIYNAMRAKKWRGTEVVEGALKTLFEMKHVEQFNFGPLSLDTLHAAQKEAIGFIEHGFWTLPFPECVFRCSVQFDNRTVGFHMFCVTRHEKPNPKDKGEIAVLTTIHSRDHTLTFRCDNTLTVEEVPNYGRGVAIQIPSAELRYWEPRIGTIKRGPVLEGNAQMLKESAEILMGLVMILNTKGVLKERTAPPAKPNKVREARGAPLLPYTTRVYTTVYNEAVREGPQGTHASPRPHLRRAHIRHYPKTDKHEAYIKKIDAMLVNWDGQPLEARAAYVVK